MGQRQEGEGIEPQRMRPGFLHVQLPCEKTKTSCSAPSPKEYALGRSLGREMRSKPCRHREIINGKELT